MCDDLQAKRFEIENVAVGVPVMETSGLTGDGLQQIKQYLVSGPAEYVNDLFKNMKIKNPEENAIKFYANMFFYYSMYDGATDKTKAKCQFEQMMGKIVEEMKQ